MVAEAAGRRAGRIGPGLLARFSAQASEADATGSPGPGDADREKGALMYYRTKEATDG